MSNIANSASSGPPDERERSRALDPAKSFLVQAPAGSGKTYLLTQRFLRLLGEAERPDEIVAITFTNAAAAEMRNRVLTALEEAERSELPGLKSETGGTPIPITGDFERETGGTQADSDSLEALAERALARSTRMGWRILELPGQLRITTIDAFCRSLALQSPLSWGVLSGLGGRLDPQETPERCYRLAARRTVDLLAGPATPERASVEALLAWRDNHWRDVEDLIVEMLAQRNRWFQGFVFERAADWSALRRRLEAPFLRAARSKLATLLRILDGLEGCREYALELARFACGNGGKFVPSSLAERAELPASLPPAGDLAAIQDEALLLEDAVAAYRDLAGFLLTNGGTWRKKGGLNVHHGFPATPSGKAGKEKFGDFVEGLAQEPGLEAALGAFQQAIPIRYEETEWELIRHCFAVLRIAAAQLQLVFAETGSVDFTEVARIALNALAPEGGFASDFAQRTADSIRHLLVDEFQDTSRNQHELLARLIAAWPEREGRSCFCVGDPMQSIYGFREAEVELFERLKTHGLEAASSPGAYLDWEPFRFEFVRLQANFRTVPSLVDDLNGRFARIFAEGAELGSGGVQFEAAVGVRDASSLSTATLHLAFAFSGGDIGLEAASPEAARAAQLAELVLLIREKLAAAAERGETKYRIAVLARTRKSLLPIAEALREARIPYRAIDLVKLNERPEVLDALTLARALMNPMDRTAWLGALRAPWCGLTLAELHLLTSADADDLSSEAVPSLLETRLPQLLAEGRLDARAFRAADRVGGVLRAAQAERAAANATLGTWLESVWRALGGADTVDAAQAENLRALWAALDALPEGEVDLLGEGLARALDGLFALPDPSASADFGVQLMTIHKSKGLEFETVVVPDLQARSRTGEHGLLSWLERGLAGGSAEAGADGDLSEFLIAPIKTRGGEPSAAKRWVDAVKQERERLESKRLFYVAATRAREDLHLFARPAFRVNEGGEAALGSPTGLLKTAWLAFGEEVEARFAAWFASEFVRMRSEPAEPESLALAAAAENLLAMPGARARFPAILRRLPEEYLPPEFSLQTGAHRADGDANRELRFERAEGGLESRLLGTAIHDFLERLSRLRLTLEPEVAARKLERELPAVAAGLRAGGLPRAEAGRLAGEALATARRAAADPVGAWILAPHPRAEAEARWTGFASSGRSTRNLRPDRVFLAPPWDAEKTAAPVWWIVDYKCGPAPQLASEAEKSAYKAGQRERYAGQLAAYAQVLRGLRPSADLPAVLPVRVGLFYPRLPLWDEWEC